MAKPARNHFKEQQNPTRHLPRRLFFEFRVTGFERDAAARSKSLVSAIRLTDTGDAVARHAADLKSYMRLVGISSSSSANVNTRRTRRVIGHRAFRAQGGRGHWRAE
jgi:hypothetical protein